MTAPLTLAGNTPRTLSAHTIETCANAGNENEIRSLWGRIKDWFLGTHKEDAKQAIYRLANASTTHAQLDAFLELTRYIGPAHADALQYCISDNEAPVFKVGDHIIGTREDWLDATPSDVAPPPGDAARLLLSMRYNEQFVAADFHRFGVGQMIDRQADTVLNAQWEYLTQTPMLVRALASIGMHCNDAEANFAFALRQEVTQIGSQTWGEEDLSAIAGRNAENLTIIVTEMFHGRQVFNAAEPLETPPAA